MNEKRFEVLFYGDVINCVRDENGKEYNLQEMITILNEQQATISALKDIFKDIITYSEWDSEKPYCSLGIAVDRKTYYKIREILNE